MSKKIPFSLGILLAIFLLPLFSFAQNLIVGRIINKADQNPIPGATVSIKGTRIGTSTAIDGHFRYRCRDHSTGSYRQQHEHRCPDYCQGNGPGGRHGYRYQKGCKKTGLRHPDHRCLHPDAGPGTRSGQLAQGPGRRSRGEYQLGDRAFPRRDHAR